MITVRINTCKNLFSANNSVLFFKVKFRLFLDLSGIFQQMQTILL